MNKTPGASDLPFAQTEISIIKKPFKELSVQPIELSPSKGKILAELPQCSIFHFAGHSFRSSNNPLDSYLALDKGPENSITVNNLLEIRLYKSPPLLAYLSACGTGQMHNYQLADESLHLISGFLLAGFRHVIGTLWEVQDAVCVDMARLTYEGMKERGLSDVSVAWALHNASRTLRDRWLESSDMASFLLERDMREMKLESGQNQERGERFQRDLVSVDDDERERLHWAPYVHFGS
jgi:CHAT domain-containing protein